MRYHLIALFNIFVWGTTFVSTKVLLTDFTPLWILLIRFTIGFIALCALRPHILHLKEKKHELLFIAAGATGIGAYYLMENVALVFTTATAVGVIVAASPLFTAILAALLGDRSSLSPRFFLGFVIAMGGLVIIGVGSSPTEEAFSLTTGAILGDALALLAGLVWAVYSILVQKITNLGYETIASTKRTFLWGLVFILPATLIVDGATLPVQDIFEWQNLSNLLFLGMFASAACFVTWGVSVKHLGPTISTTYIYLVPAITATSAIILLGEPLNESIVVGVIMTIAGLLVSQKTKVSRRSGDEAHKKLKESSKRMPQEELEN